MKRNKLYSFIIFTYYKLLNLGKINDKTFPLLKTWERWDRWEGGLTEKVNGMSDVTTG
jgi:hypothetical protein